MTNPITTNLNLLRQEVDINHSRLDPCADVTHINDYVARAATPSSPHGVQRFEVIDGLQAVLTESWKSWETINTLLQHFADHGVPSADVFDQASGLVEKADEISYLSRYSHDKLKQLGAQNPREAPTWFYGGLKNTAKRVFVKHLPAALERMRGGVYSSTYVRNEMKEFAKHIGYDMHIPESGLTYCLTEIPKGEAKK